MQIVDLDLGRAEEYENAFWNAMRSGKASLKEHSNGGAEMTFDALLNNNRLQKYEIFYGALSMADSLTNKVGVPPRVAISLKLDLNAFVPNYFDRLNEGLIRRGAGPIERVKVEETHVAAAKAPAGYVAGPRR